MDGSVKKWVIVAATILQNEEELEEEIVQGGQPNAEAQALVTSTSTGNTLRDYYLMLRTLRNLEQGGQSSHGGNSTTHSQVSSEYDPTVGMLRARIIGTWR